MHTKLTHVHCMQNWHIYMYIAYKIDNIVDTFCIALTFSGFRSLKAELVGAKIVKFPVLNRACIPTLSKALRTSVAFSSTSVSCSSIIGRAGRTIINISTVCWYWSGRTDWLPISLNNHYRYSAVHVSMFTMSHVGSVACLRHRIDDNMVCSHCQMFSLSNVHSVTSSHCQMFTLSNVQCQMFTVSNVHSVKRSVTCSQCLHVPLLTYNRLPCSW